MRFISKIWLNFHWINFLLTSIITIIIDNWLLNVCGVSVPFASSCVNFWLWSSRVLQCQVADVLWHWLNIVTFSSDWMRLLDNNDLWLIDWSIPKVMVMAFTHGKSLTNVRTFKKHSKFYNMLITIFKTAPMVTVIPKGGFRRHGNEAEATLMKWWKAI